MKTILVATDYSNIADNACHYAIEVARTLNSEIILLHVAETPLLFSGQYYSAYIEEAEKKLNAYYNKLLKIAGNVKISMTLQQGLASSRIVETAIENKVDLIVIGTTGSGFIERVLLGNNSLRIFRQAPCPVLAIPHDSKFKGISNIAYATDMKKDNITNARLLIPFAKVFNAEITFLNVSAALETKEFNEDLNGLTRQIKKHFNYPKMSGYLCNNLDISEGINYFVNHHSVDCLALYAHQHSLLQQMFGESITKKVSLHAKLPLLIIPENSFTKTIVKEKTLSEIKDN